MKLIPLKLIFIAGTLLLSSHGYAQFHGGSNDGQGNAQAAAQNSLTNIYTGGSNDGVHSATALNQNTLTNIFTGGGNDGVNSVLTTSQNTLTGIYAGGSNDGVAGALVLAQNPTNNIYMGGGNDGVSQAQQANQNPLVSIYTGGSNDGVGNALQAGQNPLTNIYTGSGNDGIASLTVNGQNPFNPLPLKLLAFGGQWQDMDALLDWKTANEINVDRFELERSIDGGLHFETVGYTNATGGAFEQNYSYIDMGAANLQANVWLYRLKTVDIDGKIAYSGIVRLTKQPGNPSMLLYPNPTGGAFVLHIKETTDLEGYAFTLSATNGTVIKRGSISDPVTKFDLGAYATGTYILTVTKHNELLQHFKIIFTK